MEGAEESLPAELPVSITDRQLERLRHMAENEGISVDELASRLFSEGIDARYRLPTRSSNVVPIEGLKRSPK